MNSGSSHRTVSVHGRTVYLVRHGVTRSNRKKIYMGRSQEGLDDEGIGQVEQLGEKLREERITRIYTSPIRRAVQTAEILSRYLSVEIEQRDDLGEMKLGEWEGMSENEVENKYPREWALWNRQPARLRLPGRETLRSLQKRAVTAIEKIAECMNDTNEKAIAVTHVAIIRCLILLSENLDLNSYKGISVPNASAFELKLCGEDINKASIRRRW